MAELKERVAVTEEEISRYLAHLRAMGRPEGTIQTYRLGLDRLYQSSRRTRRWVPTPCTL